MVNDPMVLGSAGETAESLADQRRAKDAARKRKERADKQNQKRAANNETVQDWYAGNRARLSPTELATMVQQDGDVRDVLASMELAGDEVPEEWKGQIDFISVDAATTEVVAPLTENGTAHLGPIHKSGSDIPADWCVKQFWRNSELLARLYAEGTPTENFVRFGFLNALPDWRVVEFLTTKAGWSWDKAARLVGYERGEEGMVYGGR